MHLGPIRSSLQRRQLKPALCSGWRYRPLVQARHPAEGHCEEDPEEQAACRVGCAREPSAQAACRVARTGAHMCAYVPHRWCWQSGGVLACSSRAAGCTTRSTGQSLTSCSCGDRAQTVRCGRFTLTNSRRCRTRRRLSDCRRATLLCVCRQVVRSIDVHLRLVRSRGGTRAAVIGRFRVLEVLGLVVGGNPCVVKLLWSVSEFSAHATAERAPAGGACDATHDLGTRGGTSAAAAARRGDCCGPRTHSPHSGSRAHDKG